MKISLPFKLLLLFIFICVISLTFRISIPLNTFPSKSPDGKYLCEVIDHGPYRLHRILRAGANYEFN